MYLSKLEILGFKSFALKTEVNFNPGVTSIVGPNGCGKTNIVDAIRWCLGEQKSSTLRSDKMENVIFNGTSTRKPMGMSEVSLTIQNSKGALPTEYSEVNIARRIFRSGESEYLLNKNVCRLKDITNLFMDTGMGTNAYSVIELKMVENILSSKADERRNMFEEAAGVNKYKLRRRLALRKLDEVKADLNRVNDIVSEVEKKVNSLERQAKRADKYNNISSTLRELELDLADREMALFNKQKAELKEKKELDFKKKIEIESELAELDDKIKFIKSDLTEIESKLNIKRSEITSQTEKIYNVQKNISIAEERKNSLSRNIERYKQELAELNLEFNDAEELISSSNSAIMEYVDKISTKEIEKLNISSTLDKFRVQLDEQRNSLKQNSDILMERFKEITNKENEFSNVEKSLEAKNNSINKLNDKISSLTNNIAKTVGYLEELDQERIEAEQKLTEAEAIYSQKQKEKENLEKKINTLKENELEFKSALNNLKEKINLIQNLIDNLEGVSKGAKALLENNNWAKGNKTLLAHIGNSLDEYRFAVEVALKNNLNDILIETLDDLKNGIKFLKDNRIGKASFYVSGFDDRQEKTLFEKFQKWLLNKKAKRLEKEKEFLGWALQFIQTEDKWMPFFEKMLDKTVIVESLEYAFKLSEKYSGFSFATTGGDYISKSGSIEGGSAPQADDSLFGRKQFLEKLKNEFPKRESELDNLKKEIEKVEFEINEIDLRVLSERGRLLINDLANVEKQIAQFEFEKKKADDEIEKTRQDLNEFVADSNSLDNELNRLGLLLDVSKTERSEEELKQRKLEEEFKNFEEKFNSVVANQNKINLEFERLLGEKKNTKNSVERAQDSIESIKKSISKREYDISSSTEECNSLENIIAENQLELEELNLGKDNLVNEEKIIDIKYKEVRAQIGEKENQQNSIRKEKELISEKIHLSDLNLSEIKMKMNTLIESIQENYSITLEPKTFEDLGSFNFKQRTDEVHSLKQQIKNLGPINLLAYSEFEEERQRFEFLSKQRSDLIESEKDIIKTIEEINIKAQTLFIETFEKIRSNFVNIFRGLFNPGDEAESSSGKKYRSFGRENRDCCQAKRKTAYFN